MAARATPRGPLARAFDELNFGPARTLDLRSSRPTAPEAEARLDAWLRERQASVGGDVLVITGRGRGSVDGQAVIRPVVERRLARLRRQGVVADVREHTAGSFVVALAPLSALLSAGRRAKDPPPRAADTAVIEGLESSTSAALRELAIRSLELLGAPRTDALVAHEMAHQFSRLVPAAGRGADREARLHAAIESARRELEDDLE
jgi:hypothetical protein